MERKDLKIYDTMEEATEDGYVEGSEHVLLTNKEMRALLQGKVLAFDVAGEYMEFIRMERNW